ncbi:MAG: hypothetical protein ACREMQ_00820 [Longimicrobiales bacterium]
MSTRPVYRFRDFPDLFWDAEPDAVIEPDNPFVLGRVLQLGSMEQLRQLVDLDILREQWDRLWLPPRTRYVWQKVLDLLRAPGSRAA